MARSAQRRHARPSWHISPPSPRKPPVAEETRLPRRVELVLLLGALTVGAILLAEARGSVWHGLVGVAALLPLFLAIRLLAPPQACLAGALWGFCFVALSVLRGHFSLTPDAARMALLAPIIGAYAYFGARLTRQVGFSPYLLALAWMAVELAFWRLGGQCGLLGGLQGQGVLLHWASKFTGFVLLGFLAAWVAARLTDVVCRLPIGARRKRPVPGVINVGRTLIGGDSFHLPLKMVDTWAPRAPPIPVLCGGRLA